MPSEDQKIEENDVSVSTEHLLPLIDGDKIVYSVGFATSRKDAEPEPVENALYLVKKTLQSIINKFNGEYRLFLTSADHSNFRFDIAKTTQGRWSGYKGNRDPRVNPNAPGKPLHYEAIREYMIKHWEAEVISGMEADDALCIHQDPERTIMCHEDKDLNMMYGWHYNIRTHEIEWYEDGDLLELNEKGKIKGGGWRFFYAQMLMGDTSDNIPGVPGLGPKRIVQGYEKMFWEGINLHTEEKDVALQIFNCYNQNLDGSPSEIYERYLEVADLLWMLRVPEKRKSTQLKEWIENATIPEVDI